MPVREQQNKGCPMRRYLLLLLVLSSLMIVGCGAHSSMHERQSHMLACSNFPCGGEGAYRDADITYEIQRLPSGQCVLQGTIMPRRGVVGTIVDMAVVSVELLRDSTVGASFEFPVVGRSLRLPLQFRKVFVPESGFDGLTLDWDIHYIE
jgi:hypothetical protein